MNYLGEETKVRLAGTKYPMYSLTKTHSLVVVGMSGGVDSSVTAALLEKQDLDLSAVFMRNWDSRDESGSDQGCEWEKDWEDVQLVCRALDIPARMVSLEIFLPNC